MDQASGRHRPSPQAETAEDTAASAFQQHPDLGRPFWPHLACAAAAGSGSISRKGTGKFKPNLWESWQDQPVRSPRPTRVSPKLSYSWFWFCLPFLAGKRRHPFLIAIVSPSARSYALITATFAEDFLAVCPCGDQNFSQVGCPSLLHFCIRGRWGPLADPTPSTSGKNTFKSFSFTNGMVAIKFPSYLICTKFFIFKIFSNCLSISSFFQGSLKTILYDVCCNFSGASPILLYLVRKYDLCHLYPSEQTEIFLHSSQYHQLSNPWFDLSFSQPKNYFSAVSRQHKKEADFLNRCLSGSVFFYGFTHQQQFSWTQKSGVTAFLVEVSRDDGSVFEMKSEAVACIVGALFCRDACWLFTSGSPHPLRALSSPLPHPMPPHPQSPGT